MSKDQKSSPKDQKSPPIDRKSPPKDQKSPPTDRKSPTTDRKSSPKERKSSVDYNASPKERKSPTAAKLSTSNIRQSRQYLYQLNCYYCISFSYADINLVISVIKNNPKFADFGSQFSLETPKTKIQLSENSDINPMHAFIFVSGMTRTSGECLISTNLSVDTDPEKLLVLQAEYSSEVKLLKELNTELGRVVKTELGWKSFVCKWEP